MTERNMICIECPRGCDLRVTLEDGKVTSVEGNLCPRGKKYATDECEAPRRMVTGTVRTESGELLPVRTAAPVLFEHMMDVMAAMKATTAKLPVKMGDAVIVNVADGVDLIACRSIEKK
jgi:CxxC motif-containing protein